MTDREKIISAIEKAKNESEEYALDRIIVPFKDADMIVELLKEQEEIIHCKDCIHWSEEYDHNCMIRQGWFSVSPDYFCASGNRKEGG